MAQRKASARLLLYGGGGAPLERPLEAGLLEELRDRVLHESGALAETAWKKTGMLTTHHLLACWPESLRPPAAAFLRSGQRFRTGMALQVEAPGEDLEEYAEDLLRCLGGREPVRRFDTRPAGEEAGDVFESASDPGLAVDLILEPEPEPAPRPPSSPPAARGEVLHPDERARRGGGRRWRLGGQDVFTVVGPLHPEDAFDDGLEIAEEDLPWLNPGDRIVSARRGACRIVRVDDDDGQVLARDARGSLLMVTHAELLAEFSFDDEDPPAR